MIPKSLSSTPIGDGNRFPEKIMHKQNVRDGQYCPVNLRGISEKANSGAAFRTTKGVSDLNQK
jgi:hypothetical protein